MAIKKQSFMKGVFVIMLSQILIKLLGFVYRIVQTNIPQFADVGNSLTTNFATYPDGIFKGVVKGILYTIIPVGMINYIPIKILTEFNIWLTLGVLGFTIFMIFLAFFIFNKGLKRYSSSNLMIARL